MTVKSTEIDRDAWGILQKLATEDALSDHKFGSYVHSLPDASLVFNRKRGVLEIFVVGGGWLAVKVENLVGSIPDEIEAGHG